MNSIARIEISKSNLLSNIEQFRDILLKNTATKNVKIAAVVKGNAYGHGIAEIVSIVENHVNYFQVDDLMELREIRQYTKTPVFVFGYVSIDQLSEFVELNGILGAYDLEILTELNKICGEKNSRQTVHVKIDALLGRQGILVTESSESQNAARNFFMELKKLKNINVEAIYSHFSNIEDVDNLEHAKLQHKNLIAVKQIASECGFDNLFHHISSTAGLLTDQGSNWGGAILRLGIGMYGLWPSEFLKKSCGNNLLSENTATIKNKITLKPVMRWVTQIAQVKTVPENYPIGYGLTFITKKPTKIAIIPQGYSDGYDRGFSNNGEVLISGQKCAILGRVAMNMFVVDVNGIEKVQVDDEVVLIGKQGDAEITAEDLANRIGTINYEIVTRIWPKLERVIVD